MPSTGNAEPVTVEQTVDEVQIARPAAAGADRELTRQMRLGAGRERGDLLVPDIIHAIFPCRRPASVRPFRLSPTMP